MTCPLRLVLRLYFRSKSPSSIAHFANLPDISSLQSIRWMGYLVNTSTWCAWKYRQSLPEAKIMASVNFSSNGYLVSGSLVFVLMKYTTMYRVRTSPSSGPVRVGNLDKYCFISWKACSTSRVHWNEFLVRHFLRVEMKGVNR
jgi:hypothetical protein